MWFWLAVGASVLGAVGIILSKKVLHQVSSAVLAWSLFSLTIPPLIIIVVWEGIPALSWFFLFATLGSSLVYIFSKMIFNNVLKQNLISKILPLTAFSGFFTYIFGLIFLSESIRLIPLLGLLSVIFGSYILNADQAKEDFLKPFKLLFLKKESLLFLLAIMLGSLAAIFDKSAIESTIPASPIFTALTEQIMMSFMLGIYMVRKESETWAREIKKNFGILFLNSLTFLAAGLFVFYAYANSGPVALVVGVIRFQIFFILLLSYLFFKDKPTKHAWIATAIMILGVLMIRLG